ncbi:MAG: 4Fe-4S binding protein [Deltaproteobacteria bacterium]|nr:4Fe-4S binding protein [Deltaproteobacteria bacterium]
MRIYIDKNNCHGSGECLKVCPHGALQIVDGKAVVNHERCDLDGLCLPACPHEAIYFTEEG